MDDVYGSSILSKPHLMKKCHPQDANKMDHALAFSYQNSLIFAALDDFSASDLLGGVHGGQFGGEMSAWKSAVICFLRRNTFSELIAFRISVDEKFLGVHEMLNLFSNSDPNINPEVWIGIQFHGTERLRSIIATHGMLGWEHVKSPVNEDLIVAITQIYENCGL